MKKVWVILLWLIIAGIITTGCANYAIYNHNVLDFQQPPASRVSVGMIGVYSIPYSAYINMTSKSGHMVSFSAGERKANLGYKYALMKRGPYTFSLGLNLQFSHKDGITVHAEGEDEEDDKDDDVEIPDNVMGEMVAVITYYMNNALGWISLKPGVWQVNSYRQYNYDISDYENIDSQTKVGVTFAGGFGYYDPRGVMALITFNRPYYTIDGEVVADNFFGFILGMNFSY